jgi:phenylalanyl-tRNA synthetase alpha chain
VRGERIVSIADNYDRLLVPAGAEARDARRARYVGDGTMLRSHTSALVPPALEQLAAEAAADLDVIIACPGLVYRRDAIDRLHTGTPHMIDVWRVTDRRLGIDDLYELIDVVLDAVLPGCRRRTEPRTHPYTEHGLQIDVRNGGGWVEVGECGLASPIVLASCGLPGASGLAMGLGLDRLLMLRKGIDDIRLLRSTHPRVAAQMLDLAPYRPVSDRPSIIRDLSIAVDGETDADVLGDVLRGALGHEADLVESLDIVADTPGEVLPPAAAARLGIRAGQRNLLVRLVLRALDRTLTDAEANRIRDVALAALHQGEEPSLH